MIFPTLAGKPFGYLNLNEAAINWPERHSARLKKELRNPLLDPEVCGEMVFDLHHRLGLAFSYGGWLEDRSTLWKDSYLQRDRKFIHLGVDFNAPAGTPVSIDIDARVQKIDDDHPDQHGWGPRIILRNVEDGSHLIFAHLDRQIEVREGELLRPGCQIGKIGAAPYNGGWYPHLHVQTLMVAGSGLLFEEYLPTVDGYAGMSKRIESAQEFPDPIKYIKLW